MKRAWAFPTVFLVCWGVAGCGKALPKKPDPTPEEWDHALDVSSGPVPQASGARPPVPKLPPPRLVNPAEGAVLTRALLDRDQDIIVFSWTMPAFQTSYVLELSTDRNFDTIIISAQTPRNVLPYRFKKPGMYYWRVWTDAGVESNVQRFVIEKPPYYIEK